MSDTPQTTAGEGKGGKSARRRAREFALQGLYQWRVGGADGAAIEAHLPEFEGYDKCDREFCLRAIRGVMGQRETLVSQVTAFLDRPFSELSPVEACILLMGAFELTQFPETPYRVVINECIELAKSFGGTDGHKYVNGVLDRVAGSLRPEEVAAKRQNKS